MTASLVLLLSVCAADPAPGGKSGLAGHLDPLVRSHRGKVALAVKHLESGECYYHNADEVMPTASLIKVAVLIETYLQAGEGKVKLKDHVTLHDSDKVPGSGILTNHFSEGASFSLRDAARLMIAYSDNTATNLVLDRVGIRTINRRMKEWGCPQTRINAKVFRGSTTSVDPERTQRYGLGSTTAREMAHLFEEVLVSTRLRPALKQAVLGHLKKNEDKDKFSRFLPDDAVVSHKDGATNDTRTDAGILETPGGVVVVVVLTTDNADQRWKSDNAGNLLCARVAKEVWDYFQRHDRAAGPSSRPGEKPSPPARR